MDREVAAQLLRNQQAGYKYLRLFEIDEARSTTFVERLCAFCRLMKFSKYIPSHNLPRDDNQAAQRWRKIRERYEARRERVLP